ncbi:MAG: hypothetical protein ACTSRZ_05160 [Promethearchaeota archaeon]
MAIVVINVQYFLLASFSLMLFKIAGYFSIKESKKPGFIYKSENSHELIFSLMEFVRKLGVVIGFINIYIILVDFIIYPLPYGFNIADIARRLLLLYFGIYFILEPIKKPTNIDLIRWAIIIISSIISITLIAQYLKHLAFLFIAIPILSFGIFDLLVILKIIKENSRFLWDFAEKIDKVFNWRLNLILWIILGIEWTLMFWGRTIFIF